MPTAPDSIDRWRSEPVPRGESRRPREHLMFGRGLYLAVTLLMIVIVLTGFWPFYAALPRGGTGAHWVIYLHAAIFTGWMVLLTVQVMLAYQRRIRLHQRLGSFGIWYGIVVLIMGVVVALVAPAQHVVAGRSSLDEAAGFLILPLGDMLLFGGFFAAGIMHRRNKELHKRLMVLATVALLFAPAARIAGDVSPFAILPVWLLPLGLAMAHDAATRRRIERVYLIGAAVLLAAFARMALMESEPWLVVGRRLLTPFLRS